MREGEGEGRARWKERVDKGEWQRELSERVRGGGRENWVQLSSGCIALDTN